MSSSKGMVTMPGNPQPGSKHFSLRSLDDGCYAAIAEDGGSAICNAGLIDLGGQILVFDTFLTPQAATDLRRSSIELLGHPPGIVINSHHHNDHIWGNQVFAPDAQIVSSIRTRELVTTAGMEELQWYSSNSAQQLESLRTQQQNSTDEQQLKQLRMWIGYYEGLVEALPRLSVRIPGITFKDRLWIYGTKRSAELITFEGAHTESDTVLHLPQEGILFMSDLLFVGCHPYLADGDPIKLLKTLDELGQLNSTCFIPGHGPVGTIDDLRLLMEYVGECLKIAQGLVEEGNETEARITELRIAERYQHWQLPQFFQSNIRFLCKYLDPKKKDQQD
jgi:cyclase